MAIDRLAAVPGQNGLARSRDQAWLASPAGAVTVLMLLTLLARLLFANALRGRH